MLKRTLPKGQALMALLALAVFAVLLVGCAPQATPTPTNEPAPEATATEAVTEAPATAVVTEAPATEMATEASTESASATEAPASATEMATESASATEASVASGEKAYPCNATIAGEAGAVLRNVVRQRADSTSPSIRAARVGDAFIVIGETENAEGLWYELNSNNTRYGYILAEHLTLDASCPRAE